MESEKQSSPEPGCNHGLTFDEEAVRANPRMGTTEIRARWPRLYGECPLGCGFAGISYASFIHYLAGDW